MMIRYQVENIILKRTISAKKQCSPVPVTKTTIKEFYPLAHSLHTNHFDMKYYLHKQIALITNNNLNRGKFLCSSLKMDVHNWPAVAEFKERRIQLLLLGADLV